MNRCVEPEWLDELAASDPRAAKSRRDLQRVNSWMRNTQIMAGQLRSAFQGKSTPHRLVELGAGDGTFLLRVAQHLGSDWPPTTALLVDRQNITAHDTRQGFEKLGWRVQTIAADVFDWLGEPRDQKCDAIIANLFLHHFSDGQLANLLAQAAQQSRVFVAVEPRRWAWSLLSCRLLWCIGCNEVTRHDAVLSVRAGFANDELSRLWPSSEPGAGDRDRWSVKEGPANFASHLFMAQRESETSASS